VTEEQKPSQELSLFDHALQEMTAVEAGISALESKFGSVVYDVTTTKGMEEAKKARAEIREPRYAVQNIAKAKKSELNKISKAIGEASDRIIARIEAIEEPIDKQIKAEEERKAAEKAERERVERENRQRQLDRVIGIRAVPANLIGASVAEIDTATTVLLEDDLSDLDEVYLPDARQARDKAIEDLQVMRTQRAEADALAAELRQLQAEREAREAELAEQRRQEATELERREEEARERREREESIAAAIDGLRAYAHMGRTSAEIYAAADELASIPVNADRYGDRVDAARQAQADAGRTLESRAAAAVESERVAAEQAERQRQLDAEAAERARIAQEAADAEAARQRAEAEERAQREREAQEQAIREATAQQAMQTAHDFLVAEGYAEATATKMLAAVLARNEE
jgi:hypothetical protein